MRLARASALRLSLLATALFVVATNAFVIAGVLPRIGDSIGVGPGTVAYAISVYAAVVAVASPVVSVTCARIAPERVMATGLALIAIGTLLTAASGTFAEFTAGRVLAAFGGAALVPAAMAAAPSMVSRELRGRAIAMVGMGFTLALAIGSPIGTALSDVGGWRLPLLILAGLAAVLCPTVLFAVRGIPLIEGVNLRARGAVLGDRRIVFAIITSFLMTMAFNLVYIFSAVITQEATGGDSKRLAILLLAYGVAGVAGNMLGGRLSDRFGSRRTLAIVLVTEVFAFLAIIPAHGSLVATAVLFGLCGIAGFGASIAIQYRLAVIDSRLAGVTLAWYSTALYLGVATAPLVGAAVLPYGIAVLLGAAAISIILALAASEVSHRASGPRRLRDEDELACAASSAGAPPLS